MQADRLKALEDLIFLRLPPAEADRQLRSFGWDSDGVLVTLKRADLACVLDDFLQHQLSREDVEVWANVVEGRDDVSFEPDSEAVLREMVFELANPQITTELSADLALRLKNRLSERAL